MLRLIAVALNSLCLGSLACVRPRQPQTANATLPKVERAPTPQRVLRELDLDVNGIRSGTAYEEVIRKIGKPDRSKDFGKDYCTDGFMKTIYYPGLMIKLESDERKHRYVVVGIEVTSSKWRIGERVHIGSTSDEVLHNFGPPNERNYDDAFDDRPLSFDYLTKDNLGGVDFIFENGRLIKIQMQETLC